MMQLAGLIGKLTKIIETQPSDLEELNKKVNDIASCLRDLAQYTLSEDRVEDDRKKMDKIEKHKKLVSSR